MADRFIAEQALGAKPAKNELTLITSLNSATQPLGQNDLLSAEEFTLSVICRIPDDKMAVYETDEDAIYISLSWPVPVDPAPVQKPSTLNTGLRCLITPAHPPALPCAPPRRHPSP